MMMMMMMMLPSYLVVHDGVDKNGDAVFCENLQHREHQNILSLSCIIIIVLIIIPKYIVVYHHYSPHHHSKIYLISLSFQKLQQICTYMRLNIIYKTSMTIMVNVMIMVIMIMITSKCQVNTS